MAEHVNEVEHADVEVVLLQRRQLMQKVLGCCRVVDFVIGEGVLPPIALELCAYERGLVEVFALLAVLIDPEVGKHLRDDVRHES